MVHFTLILAATIVLRIAMCLTADVAPATTQLTPGGPTTNPNLPTLFIVGDSTVHNGTRGQMGWGDAIGELFDRSRINVINRARGGRSSRTFQTEGLWEQTLAEMKSGDFVMIQFGHNDPGPLDDDKRARGTIRGIGDESREIYNPITKKQKVVHTYGWYMRKYIADAKARGVTPIVLSYIPRCPRPDSTTSPATAPAETRLPSYAQWAAEVARDGGACFIDLHGILIAHYATLRPEQIKEMYFCAEDYTHTNPAGAKRNAEAVVQGLRALKDCPLSAYLSPAPSLR